MSFESAMGGAGRMIDGVISWHLSLPWYFLVPLLVMYGYIMFTIFAKFRPTPPII